MMEFLESILSKDTAMFVEKISKAHSGTEVKEVIGKDRRKLFQWQLNNLICKDKSKSLSLADSPILRWILTDVEILEQMINSGYVSEHRWLNVIHILVLILSTDPEAKSNSYSKRLAVAIALTFSTPVLSHASYDSQAIDPVKRYLSFVKCVKEEEFFPVHTTISTWLLRYVVASWAEDEELEWARANILSEFKTPSLVGEVTHHMVPYRKHNSKGVSIHDGPIYYDNKPRTLALLKDYGAVCGGVSKFGCAMAQAFGIPACPIAQPGHCAFLWWKEGEWVMSNECSGIGKSSTHSGIQWSWNERCDYQLLFDKAQNDFTKYSFSEQLRWIAAIVNDQLVKLELLLSAVKICSVNYLIWRDLVRFVEDNHHQVITKDIVLQNRFKLWCEQECSNLSENSKLISPFSILTASVKDQMENLIDGTSSEWYCRHQEAWIELEFEKIFTVDRVEIQWWGISFAAHYSIFVAGEENQYTEEKNERDAFESPSSRSEYNVWSKLPGWSKSTTKMKIVLRHGHPDPWDMGVLIGIRQLNVYGKGQNTEKDDVKDCLRSRICSNFVDFPLIGKDLLEQLATIGIVVLSSNCTISSSVQSNIENLIDGTGSEWYCRLEEAWIELDFGRLCSIYNIDIQWWGISFAEDYSILLYGANGECHTVKSEKDAYEGPLSRDCYNEWSKLSGWSTPTTNLKLLLRKGCNDPWGKGVWIGLRQIVIKGVELS